MFINSCKFFIWTFPCYLHFVANQRRKWLWKYFYTNSNR